MNVPEGWFDYSRFGNPIDSTRIVAVKTPLKEQFNTGRPAKLSGDYARILRGVPMEEEFTPEQMLELFKERGWRVGLVIDLTFTNRYYEPQEFIRHGVRHIKIKCPGQIIPPDDIYQRLSAGISEFLTDPENDDSLVAVHCTHGLNRTGYLICRYLMERCGYDAETAITAFNKGRGTDIERKNFLEHLRNGCPKDETRKSPAPSRQPARREDLIPARREDVVSSSSSSHHGHWTSGRGRRRDEVVRDRSRRHKRNDDPVRWEGDLRSRLGQRADHRERETREVYREYRRDGDSGGGGVRGRLGKRARYEDYHTCERASDHLDYRDYPSSHHTSRHAPNTQHSHYYEDRAAPDYHVHDKFERSASYSARHSDYGDSYGRRFHDAQDARGGWERERERKRRKVPER